MWVAGGLPDVLLMFHIGGMRFEPEQLTSMALRSLEEGVRDVRAQTARPNYAIRFALAYLCGVGKGDRRFFDDYWQGYIGKAGAGQPSEALARVVCNSAVETALAGIYRSVGLYRTVDAMFPSGGSLPHIVGEAALMPIGSKHDETGVLGKEGAWLVLRRDVGGRWRLDCDCEVKTLLGSRVRVRGIRSEFDLLDVTSIERAENIDL